MPGHLRRAFAVTPSVSRDRARVRARRSRRVWALEGLEARLLLSGSPTIYTVNSTGNGTTGTGDSGTLPYVIGQANNNTNTAGSEIQFDATVFGSPQTITLASTLVLTESGGPELIDGPGASAVTISGNNAVEVFSVVSGVTASLTNLIISGGLSAGNGGGVENDGTMAITNCTIAGNSIESYGTAAGGGIYNSGALTITNSTIANNSVEYFDNGGGGIYNSGVLTITNSTIANNAAGGPYNAGQGGGVENSGGTLTVSSTAVVNNSSALASGGGIVIYGGTVTVTDSTIANNGSGGIDNEGGGVLDRNHQLHHRR